MKIRTEAGSKERKEKKNIEDLLYKTKARWALLVCWYGAETPYWQTEKGSRRSTKFAKRRRRTVHSTFFERFHSITPEQYTTRPAFSSYEADFIGMLIELVVLWQGCFVQIHMAKHPLKVLEDRVQPVHLVPCRVGPKPAKSERSKYAKLEWNQTGTEQMGTSSNLRNQEIRHSATLRSL